MASTTTTSTRKSTTAAKAPSATKAAPAKQTTKKAAPAKKAASTEPTDLSYFKAKEPSDLHRNFQEWIKENVGYEADLKTVQIVCALRHTYQRSEANQQHLKTRKAAATRAAAERAEKKRTKVLQEAKALGLL